ncbi:MAG: sodium:proton antiporter [Planctomycetes bacterium]|nr:sodium:proton antiporter [Planctomycetota bacterium]
MESLLYVLVGIVATGVAAQWLASRMRFPALLLLLLAGLFLGPVARHFELPIAIDPQTIFGDLLRPLVSLSVAVVLFEGGMSLKFAEARRHGGAVWRLIVSGLVVGFIATTLAAVYIANLSWATAATLGAILVVTGPTVILPMLRAARISLRPATMLKWEGIVNDPFGAILALLVLELAIAFASGGEGDANALGVIFRFAWTAAVSAVIGYLAALGLGKALDRGMIVENLKSPVILASVLVVFVLCEAIHHEMGLLAVTVMGLVLANVENHSVEDIRHFKEQITTLLVSTLFIVLASNLRIEVLEQLVGTKLVLIGVILFLIRPLVAFIGLTGTGVSKNEMLFVGWIAPRGVVAAAVAASFGPKLARAGYDDGPLLVPIVFGVILFTVLFHGLSIRPLAQRLGLAAKEGRGILIVGASTWVVALARALEKAGASVVIADTRFRRVSRARQEGVEVHFADVMSEEVTMDLPMERVSWVFGATEDDNYNALTCLRFARELGREAVFQLTPSGTDSAKADMSGRTPWGEAGTFRAITSRYWKGNTFKVTQLKEEFDIEDFRVKNPDAIAMFYVKDERLHLVSPTAEPPVGSHLVYLS